MTGYDAVVLGGGIVGASCFRRLAEAGLSCLLVERQRVGFGCTGYSGAMVRVAHDRDDLVASAAEGQHAFTALERESGGRVGLVRCGHLYFGEPDSLAPRASAVRARGCAAHLLDADDLAAKFPDLPVQVPAAVHEPDAGYADPTQVTRYQTERGLNAGGTVAEGVRCERLVVEGSSLAGLDTSAGRIAADTVVLAGGPATPGFLAAHGLDHCGLWAQRIQVTLYEHPRRAISGPAFVDDGLGLNGLPCRASGRYFLGLPTGERVDGAAFSTLADPDHGARTQAVAAARLTGIEHARAVGALCAADSYTATGSPAIGPVPEGPEGLFVAAGFSGGGFKHAAHAAHRVHRLVAARRAGGAAATGRPKTAETSQ